jgi:hypothetical protein
MSEVSEAPIDLGDAPALPDEDGGEFDDAVVELDTEPAPQPVFENVAEWVEAFALPHWRRNPSKHQWDPTWWQHTEALTVLEALWRAFEQMRLDGLTGMAVYMRDFFYPLMTTLTGPDGPFWRAADIEGGAVAKTWPSEPAPARMFDLPSADDDVKE